MFGRSDSLLVGTPRHAVEHERAVVDFLWRDMSLYASVGPGQEKFAGPLPHVLVFYGVLQKLTLQRRYTSTGLRSFTIK